MDAPGMSLFQGAASIHVNNSAQERLDEIAEEEDEKRRVAELQQNLANAFDDLADDDEPSSVDNSTNCTHENVHVNGHYSPDGVTNMHQLPFMNSVNQFKEMHSTPKMYCDNNKGHEHGGQEEAMNIKYNPSGAGDGQSPMFHQEFRGHLNGMNNQNARPEQMNYKQLQMMYDFRVKECQQLSNEIEKCRKQSQAEIDALQERLTHATAERARADTQMQQAHHLLASSKMKIVELEANIRNTEAIATDKQREIERLAQELKSAELALREERHKIHSAQVAHTHDTDALFREQQNRHREEVDRLHDDLHKARDRLEEKENEVKMLERRCKEREREKEEVLVEKGGVINRLASELEQAQSRMCTGELVKLKEKVVQLGGERNTAREQVKELGSKLEQTAQELVFCRNKLAATQKDFDDWRSSLHQILLDTLPDTTLLSEPPSPGKLGTLKEVLTRYKNQMQKFSVLQEELAKRDKKLEQHRKQESEYKTKLEQQQGLEMQLSSRLAMVQKKLQLLENSPDNGLLEVYKQENERLIGQLEETRAELKSLDLKYTELEMEYDKLKREKGGRATLVQEANADLLKELEMYTTQLKDTIKENGELKTLYLQACSARDNVTREMSELQTKLQRDKERYKTQEQDYVDTLEKERQQMNKLMSVLANSKEELETANKRISELQREFTDKQKEFADKLNKYLEEEKTSIRKELESCAQCEKLLKTITNLEDQISRLNIKLASQESNDELLLELKNKAEFFQKYITERFQKLQEHTATNTDHFDDGNCQVVVANNVNGTSDDRTSDDEDFKAKTKLMVKEKEIREQIAQKYTLEIKTMEMNCAKRLKEMENEHLSAITTLKQLLENKAEEVEKLKEFILMERNKISHILNSKENEISDLIKEHNALQEDYQQIKDKTVNLKEKYQEKLKMLEQKTQNERDFYRKCISDWENEKKALNNKLNQLEIEHQLLKSKYKNVKKTAFMYKEYMEKKDEHVNSELNRIQNEYKNVFLKLEERIKILSNRRVREAVSDDPSPSTSDHHNYNELLHKLENEISSLTQTKCGNPSSNR